MLHWARGHNSETNADLHSVLCNVACKGIHVLRLLRSGSLAWIVWGFCGFSLVHIVGKGSLFSETRLEFDNIETDNLLCRFKMNNRILVRLSNLDCSLVHYWCVAYFKVIEVDNKVGRYEDTDVGSVLWVPARAPLHCHILSNILFWVKTNSMLNTYWFMHHLNTLKYCWPDGDLY